MTKSLHIALLFILITFSFSCRKKIDIELQSLSKSGEEFYFGEKVPVWAVTSGDKHDMSYDWSATGGTFDGFRTQNLFENLWIAPNQVGEYTVTATAKNGDSKSTRSTSMKVTRYFFDEFQSAYTFNGNGWSTSNTSNSLKNDTDPALSRAEITASSSSAPNIRRSLNLSDLKIPFSIRVKMAWTKFFRTSSSVYFSLTFVQPTNPNQPYIREIRWEFWPTVNATTTDNYNILYETFVPSTNLSKWSTAGNTAPNPLPLITPVKGRIPQLAMAKDQLKSFTFSMDQNNVFTTYIDGVLWFTSSGISDWLSYAKTNYPGFADPLAKEFRITFPAKSGSTGTTLSLKSVYINNNGEILK